MPEILGTEEIEEYVKNYGHGQEFTRVAKSHEALRKERDELKAALKGITKNCSMDRDGDWHTDSGYLVARSGTKADCGLRKALA